MPAVPAIATMPAMNDAMSGTIPRRASTSRLSYVLIGLALLITPVAMALDGWTQRQELELILGGLGLSSSVMAALVAVCDVSATDGGNRTRRLELRC